MDYNILTMSIAPRDSHEAQVQFALERGVPAMLGVLSTHTLPFPSRSFDMVHCSRCLVPWTDYGTTTLLLLIFFLIFWTNELYIYIYIGLSNVYSTFD